MKVLHMAFNLQQLGREEIATLLCVTTKSIEVWTKQEINPLPFHLSETKKYYVWEECLNWYVNNKVVKYQKFKPADELAQAKLEGVNLSNQKLQLEIDEKEGTLLNAAEVEKVWSNILLDIKNSLLNVGHTASGSITANMNYNKKKEIIDTLIFDALDGVINKVEETVNDNDIVETE